MNWTRLTILTGAIALATSQFGCSTLPVLDRELADCTSHLSRPSVAAVVQFENQTNHRVSLSWISTGSGTVKPYRDLEPGESFSQPTYVGHLWLIRGSGRNAYSTFCAIKPDDKYEVR